jgi:hypothetical protein
VNKDLYNTSQGTIPFPDNMRNHIRICFTKANDANDEVDGYLRNQELQNQEFIDYKQLKRIKNFFDNFTGNEKELPFILNGGFEMKNWVNNELRKMREFGRMTKTNKMNTGMQNQFIDNHTKDGLDNIRPSKRHEKTINRYDTAVTESLKRINEIISKI